jgi:hypothetical protein
MSLLRVPATRLVLALPAPAEDDGAPKWIQIAEAGEFKGHASGKQFELTAAVFEQIILNFRRHPSYKADGTARVVAFDFNHASEVNPALVAVNGAPAQAWAMELEVRIDVAGVPQLWALTDLLEPARTYIREGKYQWTSLGVWDSGKDPRTGEQIGWHISSVAFTNDPFIQGMVPIAASRHGSVALALDAGDIDASDIIDEFRWIFGLTETAGLVEVTAELAKLQEMATSTAPPPIGVDVGSLVGRIKRLLGLGILATAEDVFAATTELLARLAEASATPAAPAAAPLPTTPTTAALQSRSATNNNEADMTLMKKMAAHFGIPADDGQIEARVMLELKEGDTAKTGLDKMLGLLGVTDVTLATEKLNELMGLKDLMPTIEALLQGEVSAENTSVEQDVAAVTAAYHLPPEMAAALTAHRVGGVAELKVDGCLVGDAGKRPLDLRRAARDAFRLTYAKAFVSPDQAHLLQSVATQPAAPQSPLLRAMTATQAGVSLGPAPAALLPAPAPGYGNPNATKRAEILQCGGRNHIEKAMAFLRSQPGGEDSTREDIHERACMLSRELKLAEAG